MKLRQIDTLAAMMIRGWTSTADCATAGIMCYHKRREELQIAFWDCGVTQSEWRYRIHGKLYKLEQRDRTVKTRWDRPAKIKEFRLLRVRG